MERERERRRVPVPATIVAVVSFLLSAAFFLATALGLGASLTTAADGASAELSSSLLMAIGLAGTLGLGLSGGAVGLLFRQAWGWWASSLVYAFFLLYCAKMLSPVLRLNWDHPDAPGIALVYFLMYGIPVLVSLAMGVLLFLPGVRRAYGGSQGTYTRKRARTVRGAKAKAPTGRS